VSIKALTPPQLARLLGIDSSKVLAWIRSGQIDAINIATRPDGRPRWVITPDAYATFRNRRSSRPVPPPTRRRRKDPAVIQYF
jgi:hypothetical protein